MVVILSVVGRLGRSLRTAGSTDWSYAPSGCEAEWYLATLTRASGVLCVPTACPFIGPGGVTLY